MRFRTRLGVALSLLAFLAVLPLRAPAAAEPRVVNVYNWSDYIDPEALKRFERETGIRVQYDVYDSLETLEGKLLAGHSGYDVIVPTAQPTLARLIKSGGVQKLDRAKLPHFAGLDPDLMKRVSGADPGNLYGAIYLWGSTGLGIDPRKIAALAPDAKLDSWDLLFDPANAKRIAPCGITMMDSAIDVIPTVLHIIGKSPDSTDPADLAAVEARLRAIRPYIRNFDNGGAIEEMASGAACLVFDYSGDVIQARARAAEAKQGVSLRYVAPREGAQLSFDMLAIPKDAPHPAEALAFIDFILTPEVMAGITNTVSYPNAVPASLPMIRKEIAEDPGIYPSAAALAGFFTVGPVPPAAERTRSRMWARFKAGQ
jgi:putrescine transport system substrate-binding protein